LALAPVRIPNPPCKPLFLAVGQKASTHHPFPETFRKSSTRSTLHVLGYKIS